MKCLKEIFQSFENFLKWYRNFRENLGKNLENFGNMHLEGVRGGAPEVIESIKNSRKINGNLQSFENFHE